MGGRNSSPINVFCFGGNYDIIEELFPEKIDINDKWKHCSFKKRLSFQEKETNKFLVEKIEWNATIYPPLTPDNIDELFESLQKNLNIPEEEDESKNYLEINDEDSKKKTRNIIIKFGKENVEYLIEYMKEISKVYLPQIAIVTKEPFNEEEGLLDNRYITIIKEDHKDLVSVIRDYLWTKECYYNERGSALLNQKSDNKDKINTNNFINIMVTGLSRSIKVL